MSRQLITYAIHVSLPMSLDAWGSPQREYPDMAKLGDKLRNLLGHLGLELDDIDVEDMSFEFDVEYEPEPSEMDI